MNIFARSILSFAAAGVLGSLPASAQNTDPLVFTVGKTIRTDTRTYAYVVWQAGDASTTFGKSFGVYRKDGDVASAAPYQKLGVQILQTAPSAIRSILLVGAEFDHNPTVVSQRINALYADATSQPDAVLDPAPAIPTTLIAKQLAQLFQIAEGDPQVLDRLLFLGRAHPGVMMAAGHGFAIAVPSGAHQTYEIRELNGAGNDVRVVGRVALDAKNPITLPAPGRPFAVQHPVPAPESQLVASPKDHLACRFRWGVPNNLRRLYPHAFGFNLYRVKQTFAEGMGWDVAPPDPADLESFLGTGLPGDPNVKRVNSLPILPSRLLSDVQAADRNDKETFFTHDDNEPPANRFENGETFYYFVSARCIAGHPGALSPGTRVTYCDRLPPPVPVIDEVTNVFSTTAEPAELKQLKGNQHFRIRIRQLPESPSHDAASRYYVYRWSYAQEALTKGGNPALNLAGSVLHQGGKTFVNFEDTGASAPKITPANNAWFGKTVWYTVRAEDATACNPKNLSGHSPPKSGVLRDRAGPGTSTGTIERCRAMPRSLFDKSQTATPSIFGLPDNFPGFVARITRDDDLIAGFEIEAGIAPVTSADAEFKTRRYYSLADTKDVIVPVSDSIGRQVRVRARSKSGLVSPWATRSLSESQVPNAVINIYQFDLSVLAEYIDITTVPPDETPPLHEPDGPSGSIVGAIGTLIPPPGTFEWRLYRKVLPDGPLIQLLRGAGASIPPSIEWTDPAPVTVNGAEICYYAQVFDEHGNSGPLHRLGCIKNVSSNLPAALLAKPELLAANNGQAQIKLNWFCDPVGVDRFEVWCAADGSDDPGISGAQISPPIGSLDGTVINDDVSSLVFTAYQTPALSGGFGNGAEYELTLFVPVGKIMHFAIRAVGSGAPDSRAAGTFSNVGSELWKDPNDPAQPVVPWPDRALPIVNDLNFQVAKYTKGEGPLFAQILPNGANGSAAILVGVFDSLTGPDGFKRALFHISTKPEDTIFKFRRQNNPQVPDQGFLESLLPFVVYRHQVPNATFPNAVPNLTQVSPLIDRIAYKTAPFNHYDVRDPFFLYVSQNQNSMNLEVPTGGVFQRNPTQITTSLWEPGMPNRPYFEGCDGALFWRDTMPNIKNASYQYLLVHLTPRGEIDRVLPTNIVHP